MNSTVILIDNVPAVQIFCVTYSLRQYDPHIAVDHLRGEYNQQQKQRGPRPSVALPAKECSGFVQLGDEIFRNHVS